MPNYSLTEIETQSRKAARGAGYVWGEADDLSKGVRWLCANGHDGMQILLGLLQDIDGRTDECRPTPALFRGEQQVEVCGLSLGCALSDRGAGTLDGITINANVLCPMIALAILGNSLRDCAIHVTTDSGTAIVSTSYASFGGTLENTQTMRFEKVELPDSTTSEKMTHVDPELWSAVNVYAHRTYVPATEESRLKGAG
jgi:hypothetical protein